MFEVERKFHFTDVAVDKLNAAGARLLSEQDYADEYYDTVDHKMTAADHWLRKRNGKWQLKCPVAGYSGAAGAHKNVDQCQSFVTVYDEITNEQEIFKVLQDLFIEDHNSGMSMSNAEQITDCENFEGFLDYCNCHVFAEIRTRRNSYRLDGFTVDLDTTDDGFRVGEIEILVDDKNSIPDANKRIDRFAETMGFSVSDRIAGKMETYLIQHDPEHYKKLVDLKILCNI